MITIRFNTKKKILRATIPGQSSDLRYENIKTIKPNMEGFYDVLQAIGPDNNQQGPVLRVPIIDTIIIYEHD